MAKKPDNYKLLTTIIFIAAIILVAIIIIIILSIAYFSYNLGIHQSATSNVGITKSVINSNMSITTTIQ